jgi:hypothetical protein
MRRVPALLLLFLYSYPAVLRAQSTNASITGRVTDPSKAVIVDAKVAAINGGTNARYEGATNGSGEYYLTNLAPGGYRIEIEKTGFRKLIKSKVVLHLQGCSRQRLRDDAWFRVGKHHGASRRDDCWLIAVDVFVVCHQNECPGVL